MTMTIADYLRFTVLFRPRLGLKFDQAWVDFIDISYIPWSPMYLCIYADFIRTRASPTVIFANMGKNGFYRYVNNVSAVQQILSNWY